MSMSPAWIAEKTSSAIPGQNVCNDTASLVELGKVVNWQQSFWNHSINAKWLDHFTHKIRTTTPLPKTACIPSLLKGRLSNSTLTSSLFVDHNCSDLSRHFIITLSLLVDQMGLEKCLRGFEPLATHLVGHITTKSS